MAGRVGMMNLEFQPPKIENRNWIVVAVVAVCVGLLPGKSIASHDITKPAATCPPLDNEKLKDLVDHSESKKVELVFFSSWCSDCGNHLKKLEGPKKILVGTFDKQPRIERLVAKLKLANRCFTDAGIAKKLKVTTVPAELSVTSSFFAE
ncbi:MAG: hypothetical protein EBR09_05045 [Proteobacteria bacterium]|nr:hypothetical protein [Pseudomonadota bacterium]